MNEPILMDKNKDKLGRFVKGSKPNPTGKNGYTLASEIEQALNNESKRQGYNNFPKYVAKRALINDNVLIAVLKKICPDLIRGEGFGDTTNIYAIINRIQQEFVSKDSESSLVLDRGDGVDARRTRSDDSIQEISEKGLS